MTTHSPLPPESQRLSKAVAAQVPCSRREAEQLIVEGWVRVDGVCQDQPETRVTPAQCIEVDPQARREPVQPATLLMHKPAGAVLSATADWMETTRWADDPSGMPTRRAHRVGLKPLLPMSDWSSGLCVYSQDPRVMRKLTEDAAWLEQEWVVDVTGDMHDDGLDRLRQGLVQDGRVWPPVRVSWQSESRLRFALKGVAPDALGTLCEAVGLRAAAARRLRIGRVGLAGLPVGQWRYLSPTERF